MAHPFKNKSLGGAKAWVHSLNFNEHVYPGANAKRMFESIKTQKPLTAPCAIFIPTQELIRVMIRAVLKYGKEDENKLFQRFGLLELKANSTFLTEFKHKGTPMNNILSRKLRPKALSSELNR